MSTVPRYEKYGWTRHETDYYNKSVCFYQKRISIVEGHTLVAHVVEYAKDYTLDGEAIPKGFMLVVSIPKELSVNGCILDTRSYPFSKFDPKKMEEMAEQLIKTLTVKP